MLWPRHRKASICCDLAIEKLPYVVTSPYQPYAAYQLTASITLLSSFRFRIRRWFSLTMRCSMFSRRDTHTSTMYGSQQAIVYMVSLYILSYVDVDLNGARDTWPRAADEQFVSADFMALCHLLIEGRIHLFVIVVVFAYRTLSTNNVFRIQGRP